MLAGISVGQLAALALTYPVKGLGTATWHHGASLLAVLLAAVLLRKPMASRRFLAIGVLAFSVLATVSGFYLLYWKEGIRVDGYQDWGVFWHVAWSWAAAVFFWQHTWVNRVAYGHFLRGTMRAAAPAALHLALYAALLLAFGVTWGPVKGWFTVDNYIPLTFATWLACLVVAYVAWMALRRNRATHLPARGGVDVALVPMAALATLSGLPLLLFDPELDAAGLKYASKYWHVWPSVAFAVLVFTHSAQLWPVVRAHWRRLDTKPQRESEGA